MLVMTAMLAIVANVTAELVFYTDEAAFMAALDPGYGLIHESFEDDAVWGSLRSTIVGGTSSAASVLSKGLTWTSNNLSSNVTTSGGAARTGDWGFYSIPHGSYSAPDPGTDCLIPGDCGDGCRVNSGSNLMYGLGGWVDTNTPFAKVGLFVDTYTFFGSLCDTVDCDDISIGTSPQFVGVIDPLGFTQLEFRELEGKLEPFGGDIKLIFADDFTIAVDAAFVPLPSALLLFGAAVVGLVGLRKGTGAGCRG